MLTNHKTSNRWGQTRWHDREKRGTTFGTRPSFSPTAWQARGYLGGARRPPTPPSAPADGLPATQPQSIRGRRLTRLKVTQAYSLEVVNSSEEAAFPPVTAGNHFLHDQTQSDYQRRLALFLQRLRFPAVSFALNKVREPSGGNL